MILLEGVDGEEKSEPGSNTDAPELRWFPKRDWHWERFNALSDLGLIMPEKNLIQIFPCCTAFRKKWG